MISVLSLSTDMIVGFCGESEQVCVLECVAVNMNRCVYVCAWLTRVPGVQGVLCHALYYTLYYTGSRGQPVIDARGGV